MTPERLAEIRQRADAATPGPWYWRNSTEVYLLGERSRAVMTFARMGMQGAQPQFRDGSGLLVDAGKANLHAFPDALFIAKARTDVADLLAHIDAQAAEITRLRQQLAQYADGRPSLYRDPKGPTP